VLGAGGAFLECPVGGMALKSLRLTRTYVYVRI
jgi:hypothetical protein